MTTDNPATTPPRDPDARKPPWRPSEPIEVRHDAQPIPSPSQLPESAIFYPADETQKPGPIDHVVPSPPPTYAAPAVPVAPVHPPSPNRTGPARGLLLGLLLGAIIAAAAFGLGRLAASDAGDPVATASVETTIPTTSPVAATEPPPVAVPPRTNDPVEPVAAAAAAVSPAVVQLDTSTGTGSGVVYDADGYILTAAHVVGNATNVTVRFADGSRTTGTVVGADETSDVAVVAIEPGEVPAVAVLALRADLVVGQTAVAVGSPFRLDQTVTSGIVSAVERIVGVNRISMVQTDAAINPGNSGGPLVDLNGHVIGINDVIFTNSGDNAGVGFAISIDLAKIVADQITAGKPVALALLGVEMAAAPNGDAGGLVTTVSPGTGAAEAGLEVGDLIISIDGDPIRDPAELRAEVITRAPGTNIELILIRNGEQITLGVELGSVGTG